MSASYYSQLNLSLKLPSSQLIETTTFKVKLGILPESNPSILFRYIPAEASYCRAVLKESLRMNPISVGVGRLLNKEAILGGYRTPQGTMVVTQNMITCRLEKYFHNPAKFIPERWMRSSENKAQSNPYLVLPFGHGMRACIARRMAEQNILVLLLRLIRSFEIEWAGTVPMDVETKLINQPDQPIKIKFSARKA